MAETLDLSQTKRIVFLIDLQPLLNLRNPNAYVTNILAAARTLLTFPSLSSSLFAFKLFFSSLSPLLSSSKLHRLLGKSAASFSFNHPTETLHSLSETLNSFSSLYEAVTSPSQASLMANSMLQLVHDYAWDPQIQDPIGTQKNFALVRSNLILLFSPISRSIACLSEFMGGEVGDESLIAVDAFCKNFSQVFGTVKDRYVNVDIHFSWIDVKYELECAEEMVEDDESILGLGFIKKGIKSLGWGFCSTHAIILGSAIVPFGLIYPNIGCSPICFDCNESRETVRAELSLEISDVSGKPLECKCCDLDLLNLKLLPRFRSGDVSQIWKSVNSDMGGYDQEKTFWGYVGDGITKIRVKAVQRADELVGIEEHLRDLVLVREFSGECGKDQKDTSGVFFVDRVLKILRMETCEFTHSKHIPFWQLLLSFLYREGYSALVSVSNGNVDSFMGILKPVMVHLALLSIIDSGSYNPHDMLCDFDRSFSLPQFTKTENDICKANADINYSNELTISRSGTLLSKTSVALEIGKRKKNKKHLKLHQDLSWSSFCKAVLSDTEIDLEEVYFVRECNNSKKLRFLKCWMKQIKKSSRCCRTEPNELKSHEEIEKEREERLVGLQQGSEQPVSSPLSAGEDSLPVASRMKEGAACVSCSETAEAFFAEICQKIQHGLESEKLDLGALAEHLVDSSILWLYWKHETNNNTTTTTPPEQPDDTYGGMVAADLVEHLLKEPKDLAVKYKGCDPSSHASGPNTVYTSENIVREYELQILFRMEILRSKVGASIEEPTKQKIVKQICSFLEIIQCHMAGGFFGDLSLDTYVEKTIKNRYSHSLGDMVRRIYTRMDLFLFDEKDGEAPSEDSDQPWRDKLDKKEIGRNAGVGSESISAEDESSQPLENDNGTACGIRNEEYVRQLMEAQHRRERAKRFASFTSWAPDLQRVWAPKHPKVVNAKPESLRKLLKRKERRGASYVVVCETPMTDKKRSCSGGGTGDGKHTNSGINSCGSVPKALFQEDGDMGSSTVVYGG
ncbi:hypothetical protein HHK36_000117 [Tetracentron sinense]|uniref:Uncharacterized protein n=1 Tax=Tetracentron sinense TaxID=13715 RepID=A0A834ZRD8_TETSI|nr:hypothetical protein HHK36_000117 [Tetracentron sinense]